LVKLIAELKALLQSKPKRMKLIQKELEVIKEKYGDSRRTEIIRETEQFSIEEMIAEEEMVITISHNGYVKRIALSAYKREQSGKKGTSPTSPKEDFVEHLFVASTHSQLLFFTEAGRCYWLKVLDIPLGGKLSKGKVLRKILNLNKDEKVTAIVSIKEFDKKSFFLMVTQKGQVKKISTSVFNRPRKTGVLAITTRSKDKLVDVHLTDGKKDVLLVTAEGKAIRFSVLKIRDMGRTASGVRGINLASNDCVVSSVVIRREGSILAITDKGYAKRSSSKEYRTMGRGGKGIVTFKVTDKVGKIVSAKEAHNEDDVIIITSKGVLIRRKAASIKIQGRNTQGEKLLGLGDSDYIADVAVISKPESK
jgi:DNA gyrase subunit A